LREEHGLRVFENRALKRIFRPKREEERLWRKVHNDEYQGLYSSQNIVRVIKLRPMWSCWSPIGCLPRWQIGECSPDMAGTGEIKYPGQTKTNSYCLAVRRGLQRLGEEHPKIK
jgi:hypothetical protein